MATLGTPGDLGYPDRLRIVKPGTGGVQNPTTGEWTAAPVQVVYDGAAAFYDTGAALRRTRDGRVVEAWECEAYLPPAAEKAGVLATIRPDQPCTLEWADGSRSSAEVIRARRIDAVVELTRLVAL
ncbi:MAG TPA: hypothetical protein VLD58_12370 [Gemmatimonadales bacterium]|nr:hypothetical protein [Gemmatimonadales bacterium]